MSFPQDFSPSTTSGYTMRNLESGKTVRIRFMTDFVVGRSVWTNENTVYRVTETESIPVEKIGNNKITGKPNAIKQFIAAICYNYDSGEFEIFETDKGSIISKLWDYSQDPDYGDSKNYDIKIGKTGSGLTTKYSVVAAPPKEVEKEIADSFAGQNFDLSTLFTKNDDFGNQDVNF